MTELSYRRLAEHYEKRFAEHGATARGMDWPNEVDLPKRFDVMLGVCSGDRSDQLSLLDLGCGVGLLFDHIQETDLASRIKYHGMDISAVMIDAARRRHPAAAFDVRDVLVNPPEQDFDYVVMNGLLTERAGLGFEEMERFAEQMIGAAFGVCRRGIAFNVMSAHVDWTREDLFHWPFDRVASFLRRSCTRHIVIRADYGLYEYTVYSFREPRL